MESLSQNARKLAKDLFWRCAGLSDLRKSTLAGVAVVVGLHRVFDGPKDIGLDCGTVFFDRLCRFFKKHFQVVPLGELVSRIASGDLEGPHLAITFDDGYQDNLTLAAPILVRHGLPATFFLTTGFIGSDEVPWWDATEGQSRPFMSWDEVRELRGMGFDLGAHTRTHRNLAELSGDDLWEETNGARRDMSEALDEPPTAFAYPFGKSGNITEAARDAIRRAGFRCCCALDGGINRAGQDPFSLRRIPVSNWYVSPAHFGGDVLVQALKH